MEETINTVDYSETGRTIILLLQNRRRERRTERDRMIWVKEYNTRGVVFIVAEIIEANLKNSCIDSKINVISTCGF